MKKNNRSVFLLLAVALAALRCDIPGCGPGDVPHSPWSSNLVDYTLPASQSILRPSLFGELDIVFLRSIVSWSFSVADDLEMCRVPSGAESCDPEDPDLRIDAEGVFQTRGWWGYGGEWSAKLVLDVNASMLEPARYLVRLKKDGSTPVTAWVGMETLSEDVDIFFTLVANESPVGHVSMDSANIDEGIFNGYFIPHHQIRVTFRDRMGFINLVPEPLDGFNFRNIYRDGYWRGMESDSILGLKPGVYYQFDVLTDDAIPNNLPWTMDSYGNLLYESYSREFVTSHARIVFPLHDTFSEEPENWLAQLHSAGEDDEVYFVSKQVDVLTASGFEIASSIPFPDRPVTQAEKDASPFDTLAVRVEVAPEQVPECQRLPDGNYTAGVGHRQNLQVFAWRQLSDDRRYFLGSDRLVVDPMLEGFDPGFPRGYSFIGDNPRDDENGFSEELQGVAHDEDNWYFSTKSQIWKVPKYSQLGEVWHADPTHGVHVLHMWQTPLAELGYDHFGDLDYIPKDGVLIVPVERTDKTIPPVIAFINPNYMGGTMDFIGFDFLGGQAYDNSAAWCAYSPVDGLIYSSSGYKIENNDYFSIKKYSYSLPGAGSPFGLTEEGHLYIYDGDAWRQLPRFETDGLEPALHSIQGGVFSPNGHLYLVTGYYDLYGGCPNCGIWVFDLTQAYGEISAVLRNASCEYSIPGFCDDFIFHYEPVRQSMRVDGYRVHGTDQDDRS